MTEFKKDDLTLEDVELKPETDKEKIEDIIDILNTYKDTQKIDDALNWVLKYYGTSSITDLLENVTYAVEICLHPKEWEG